MPPYIINIAARKPKKPATSGTRLPGAAAAELVAEDLAVAEPVGVPLEPALVVDVPLAPVVPLPPLTAAIGDMILSRTWMTPLFVLETRTIISALISF